MLLKVGGKNSDLYRKINKKSTHNADNGCLGIQSRGRTHIAAILVGEVLRTCDPAVSEWSNPSRFIGTAIREHGEEILQNSVWRGTA